MVSRSCRERGRLFTGLLCVCLLAVFACCLAGCVYSETITQKIYEQTDDNEVDEEAQTLLVNTLDAEQTSDALPTLATDNTSKDKDKTEENLPQYGEDLSDVLVAQVEESEDAADDQVTSGGTGSSGIGTTSAGMPEDGDDEGASSEDGEGDAVGEGENPEAEGDTVSEVGAGKNEGNEVKVYSDYGDIPEIPEGVTHVTAVGQAAVIVSMLGGTEDDTPLVGADEDFTEDAQVQKVLAAKGVSQVQTFWENDGDAEGDLIDIDAIINSETELCFVLEDDDTFTEAQEDKLVAANIIVYVLPELTTATKITYAVELVGQILEEGGNEQAGELYEEYVDYHDELVSTFKDKNGGLAGGFNYNTGKTVSSSADEIVSLFISDWDYTADYDDANGSYLSSSQGVGISAVGYKTSPLSYYMSVGGVVNNAAANSFRTVKSGNACVWQFSQTQAPCAWKRWNSIDRTKATYAIPASDGMTWSLLWSDSLGEGLGTDSFPAVIVADQKMKTAMQADAKKSNGLYYPYPVTVGSRGGVVQITTVGYYSGSNLVSASIGKDSDGNSVLNDGSTVTMYDIYVNPQGLFCSWTEGSVESVLESAWIYKTFIDSSYAVRQEVKDFYSTFYGYSLSSSELDTILDGPES